MAAAATSNPRFPIYIPSKGRFDTRLTAKALTAMGVPYRMVVEEQEWPEYVKYEPRHKLLVLDKSYQDRYDDLMHLLGKTASQHTKSKGSGPARNFIWEHSISEGYSHHWVMDDNIRGFCRLHGNDRVMLRTGAGFYAMEDFCLRYANLAMAGPSYDMFAFGKRQEKLKPFSLNTRVFSCNLIRNDVPLRWRGRYNEDIILTLDMLKAGWCTVQFIAFTQRKLATQTMKGGNAEIYARGTLDKSRMLVAAHPDVARLVHRYRRDHHYVDRMFKDRKLRLRPDAERRTGTYEYGMRFVAR